MFRLKMGFCPWIENYSEHASGRNAGNPPWTLRDYFPRGFLFIIIDGRHQTVPQHYVMYHDDRSRKLTLIEHELLLPSALGIKYSGEII
jgi:excinuclease ABC subunit B